MKSLDDLSDARFCFFIDGLDEAETQDRQRDLAKALLQLANLPNIKLCVSSRPWEVFKQVFSGRNIRLPLESLTRTEIASYAREQLVDSNLAVAKPPPLSDPEITELVDQILMKADGVFLWVRLVVHSLTQRLACSNYPELEQFVEAFPRGLHDYFRVMVTDRIESTWVQGLEMVKFFKWTMVVHQQTELIMEPAAGLEIWQVPTRKQIQCEGLRSWCNYVTINDFGSTLVSETSRKQLRLPGRRLDKSQMRRTYSDFAVKLNSSYGGLLEIDPNPWDSPEDMVRVTHRSVIDFLQSSDMELLFRKHLPVEFHDEDLVAKTLLVTSQIFSFPRLRTCGILRLALQLTKDTKLQEEIANGLVLYLPLTSRSYFLKYATSFIQQVREGESQGFPSFARYELETDEGPELP